MGEVNRHKRQKALRIKRGKREKVHKLLAKMKTVDPKERERLRAKIQRIAPFYPLSG
ncbi:MAG TPA: hypothetical protein VMT46_01945 [Anaerolineaceae bacterium]|nr:hypothetical protein [Anaerolineaceae bacterium]